MSAGRKTVLLEIEILRKRLMDSGTASTDPFISRMLRVFEFLDDGSYATEFFAEILELLSAERARLYDEVVRLTREAPPRIPRPFVGPFEPPDENKSRDAR